MDSNDTFSVRAKTEAALTEQIKDFDKLVQTTQLEVTSATNRLQETQQVRNALALALKQLAQSKKVRKVKKKTCTPTGNAIRPQVVNFLRKHLRKGGLYKVQQLTEYLARTRPVTPNKKGYYTSQGFYHDVWHSLNLLVKEGVVVKEGRGMYTWAGKQRNAIVKSGVWTTAADVLFTLHKELSVDDVHFLLHDKEYPPSNKGAVYKYLKRQEVKGVLVQNDNGSYSRVVDKE